MHADVSRSQDHTMEPSRISPAACLIFLHNSIFLMSWLLFRTKAQFSGCWRSICTAFETSKPNACDISDALHKNSCCMLELSLQLVGFCIGSTLQLLAWRALARIHSGLPMGPRACSPPRESTTFLRFPTEGMIQRLLWRSFAPGLALLNRVLVTEVMRCTRIRVACWSSLSSQEDFALGAPYTCRHGEHKHDQLVVFGGYPRSQVHVLLQQTTTMVHVFWCVGLL